MYRIDFDDVSERLQFILSRLVTRRLCIEMTELQNYRHSVNTFDHTFYSLDSYCESFCILSHAKHTNLRCLPFRKKNDLIISALPPLQRQALNRLHGVILSTYFQQRLFRKALWFTFVAVTIITFARSRRWRWMRHFFSEKGERQQRIYYMRKHQCELRKWRLDKKTIGQ